MATKTAKKTTGTEDPVADEIVRLRDEENANWSDIATAVGLGQGRAMFLYMKATTKPGDRIKFSDDDDLATQVVKLRNEGLLSWGLISARSGVSEGKLKRLYEDASGTPALGHRIGKGGRFPTNGERPAKAEKVAAKPKKLSAKAKKDAEKAEAEATPAPSPKKALVDMSLGELQKRLNGKTITVEREGGRKEKIAVKNIKSYKNGEVVFVDAKGGKSRTVLMAQITAASR